MVLPIFPLGFRPVIEPNNCTGDYFIKVGSERHLGNLTMGMNTLNPVAVLWVYWITIQTNAALSSSGARTSQNSRSRRSRIACTPSKRGPKAGDRLPLSIDAAELGTQGQFADLQPQFFVRLLERRLASDAFLTLGETIRQHQRTVGNGGPHVIAALARPHGGRRCKQRQRVEAIFFSGFPGTLSLAEDALAGVLLRAGPFRLAKNAAEQSTASTNEGGDYHDSRPRNRLGR